MDLELNGKRAVVTGGSAGIGLATVRLMLADGARVALCGRDQDRLDAALAPLSEEFGGAVMAARCDVLEEDQVAAFRAQVLERFGGLDILVNNAGQGRQSSFASTTDAEWEAELRLKFFSVIRPTRAFLPDLKASDAGAIVVVNSIQARQPQPHMVATAAARAGVQNLIKSMANEFAPEVRVNAVLVGIIDSGQWEKHWREQGEPGESKDDYLMRAARERGVPLGRIGRPEEPAAAVAFLASPVSGFTTGASLEVSGGTSRFA